MLYRKLSVTGDYIFGQNSQDFYYGADATKQSINTRLHLLLGEWWENVEDGLPLFEQILSQRLPNGTAGVDLLIQEQIRSAKNVVSITEYNSSFDSKTRQYTFSATVLTPEGTITVGSVY